MCVCVRACMWVGDRALVWVNVNVFSTYGEIICMYTHTHTHTHTNTPMCCTEVQWGGLLRETILLHSDFGTDEALYVSDEKSFSLDSVPWRVIQMCNRDIGSSEPVPTHRLTKHAYFCVCLCVCVYTHIQTHTYTYVCMCVCVCVCVSSGSWGKFITPFS